jgi:hypothetical protein
MKNIKLFWKSIRLKPTRATNILVIVAFISLRLPFSAFAEIVEEVWREIPPNDFRISHMGPDGHVVHYGHTPAVAYNETRNEFLVVWEGHYPDGIGYDREIFAQRIDAATGSLTDGMLRVSFMGPDGNINYKAADPDVAYNPKHDDYLVVWEGTDDAGDLTKDEFEIWGQKLNYSSSGVLRLAGSRIRVSDMGPDGSAFFSGLDPAVDYNHQKNEFLVVWEGDDHTSPLVNDENEIFGQYLKYVNGALTHKGSDFRISWMGPDGGSDYDAHDPDISSNRNNGQCLVVWSGDHHTFFKDDEFEIWGRRILSDGSLDDTFLFSDMGGVFDADYDAFSPAVTFNPGKNEWLVVWSGNEYFSSIVGAEIEIFGQFVKYSSATNPEVGDNDFRISDMGLDLSASHTAKLPAVAFDPLSRKYLVVWEGDDNTAPLVDDEFEIFGQLIDADTRSETGESDFRLSDMGPDRNTFFSAMTAAVASAGTEGRFLVLWSGDDDIKPLVNYEYEVFGQLYGQQLESLYLPLTSK